MAKILIRELDNIKKMISSLGAMVEERVRLAVEAMVNQDWQAAQQIIKQDYQVDEMEVEVEEECLKVLALHQPVAVDLRFLIAVIKINNDLERIGDQAVNIAQRVGVLAKHHNPVYHFDYTLMAQKSEAMLRMSLDALVNLDEDLAFKVVTMDDEVDLIQKEAYDHIKNAMKKNPGETGYLINLFLVSRRLERLADHATNIAEEVIYLVEGEIIRHGNY